MDINKKEGVYDGRSMLLKRTFFLIFLETFMSIVEDKFEAHEKNNNFDTVSFSARKNSKRSKNQRLRGILQAL